MDEMQEPLFTTVKLEDFVPADHPLRPLRLLVNQALKRLNGLFGTIYADSGRASIAPEKLLRALLLQVFYSVRSERMLMEQMRYNLLFRWFVGLAIEDAVWDHSVFSKNRDRLLEHDVVEAFFTEVMSLADKQGLLSREHFSVDGTLIQAWASHKSFRPTDGSDDPPAGGGRNVDTDWKGKRRSNDTHESSTDPDARLFRKGRQSGAILCYQGHILMENRSGLVVGAVVSHADGFGERASALRLLDCVPGRHAKTLGADKGYDMRDFVRDCRARKVTPHVARNDTHQGGSAIDGRTSRHAGYGISQVIRKRIEEHFGWGKTVGRIRQTAYRGLKRVDQHFKLTMLASNLTRMARMLTVVPPQGAVQ
ncbi:IS5-like element ISButh6 family transposase [Burkholderia sola]|uniref:IS5-like element ISButh6 family transposase n=1 Tax=Burkholderia sola TaxID=2843302 RepID=UPI001C0A853A